jgi:5-methylcytosine-specific restriction endonuclease McrA
MGAASRVTCSKRCSNKHRAGINYKQTGKPLKSAVVKHASIRSRLIEFKGAERCERCSYEKIPEIVQVHHIVERSKGGSDEMANLEFLCPTCHMEEHWHRRKNLDK